MLTYAHTHPLTLTHAHTGSLTLCQLCLRSPPGGAAPSWASSLSLCSLFSSSLLVLRALVPCQGLLLFAGLRGQRAHSSRAWG